MVGMVVGCDIRDCFPRGSIYRMEVRGARRRKPDILRLFGYILEHHLAIGGLQLHAVFCGGQSIRRCGEGVKAESAHESGSHCKRNEYGRYLDCGFQKTPSAVHYCGSPKM